MLAIERRNLILERLQKEKRVLVNDLSNMFEVSEETIRRDLEKLEQDGFVIKTYGGAVLNEDNYVDLPFAIRKNTNVVEKQIIARLIADMVTDGEHIMMDSSSTAVFAVKYLKNKRNLTVITNSVEVLIELSDVSGWHIVSTGGNLREGTLSLGGTLVEKVFSSYFVDTAIISCKGIDAINGITDSNEANAHFKANILEGARRKVLVIDHTKFDKTALIRIATLKQITHVVTDVKPSEKWLEVFGEYNINCIYP